MLEQEILTLLSSIQPILFWTIIKIIIVLIIVRIIYKLVSTTVDYLMFRTDRYIAYGSRIIIDDEEWWIQKANIFWIHLENENYYKQVSPTRWKWIQPKIKKG